MSLRLIAAVVLPLLAALSIQAWSTHLIAKGDAQGATRVRTEWKTADLKRQADEMEARAKASQQQAEAERQAREAQQIKNREAERIANVQAQREEGLRYALARSDARNRGLLNTIERLNARPLVDVSGAAPSACSTALAHEASTARELLGQCSSRYTALGSEADGLRVQVMGLQDYVKRVALPTTEEKTDGL